MIHSHPQAMCKPDAHHWKAGFCWAGCTSLIFYCAVCPTVRNHSQEEHEAAMARKRARAERVNELVDLEIPPGKDGEAFFPGDSGPNHREGSVAHSTDPFTARMPVI
jgi:hypothetical protein